MIARLLIAASALAFLPACNYIQPVRAQASAGADVTMVNASVMGTDGTEIGNVMLKQGAHGVLLRAEFAPGALTPGWHGLHLHQVADCSDTGIFKLSGGHVGKIDGGHGLLNPAGPEGGDTPNIYAAADGSAAMEIITARVTLAELVDADGSALIVHEGEDDHITQPIGGAGARVACAAIGG